VRSAHSEFRKSFLSKTRPFAYTIILIPAAIIAPTPDPMTFVALAIPIIAMV